MKVVYIAGKFRGPTAWDVAENVREAERWALKVAHCGGMPLCPHANTAHFDGQLDDSFWLNGTLELLKRCDGAVFIPGWTESRGACAEHAYAERNRIEIWGFAHVDTPEFRGWCRS